VKFDLNEPQIVDLRVGSYSECTLATIECLTLLHAGTGRGEGVSSVDLQIQRDAFGFPMISGSSLKGPIRQLFKKVRGAEEAKAIFGKDPDHDSDEDYYAGAVLILDARLISIPVRSLKGIYVEATCPYMLSNFSNYAESCNNSKCAEINELLRKIQLEKENLIATSKAIEDFALELKSRGKSIVLGDDLIYKANSSDLVEKIASALGLDSEKLVICHDDDMHDSILKRAIVVTQRIKINEDTKTVSGGGLWTEENLPQKSRFVTALFYSDSRKPSSKRTAQEIKTSLEEVLRARKVMILGGDETVGRGLCKINF
jgi:CRISPR-associated protein Cmr4